MRGGGWAIVGRGERGRVWTGAAIAGVYSERSNLADIATRYRAVAARAMPHCTADRVSMSHASDLGCSLNQSNSC